MAEIELKKLGDDSFSPTFMRNATAYGVSKMLRLDIVLNNLVASSYFKGKIIINSDGKAWRPMVHVDDICTAFDTVIKSDVDKIHNQAFNVGSNEQNYQIFQLAEFIKNQYPHLEIKFMNSDSDDRSYKVNFDKISNVLGFKAKWDIPTGITQLYNAYNFYLNDIEDFYNRKFIRLKNIEYLINNAHVNKNLYWMD